MKVKVTSIPGFKPFKVELIFETEEDVMAAIRHHEDTEGTHNVKYSEILLHNNFASISNKVMQAIKFREDYE